MQLKPITGIVVPFLVIASLLVAGCEVHLTPTVENQASNVSTAYPTAGKSELLQGIVAYENNSVGSRWDYYKVTWINNTAVKIEGKSTLSGGSPINTYDITFKHFPTVNAASAYFDGKRPQYSQKSGSADYLSLYSLVTDQDATVIKSVWYLKSSSLWDDVTYRLEQLDALIVEDSVQSHTVNQAGATPSPTLVVLQ